MEQSVKEVLEEAVQRYCNGDKQSDDIILATVSSAITVDCLRQGDEVELSQFQLSNPPISWTVKLKVEAGDVIRIVLSELFALDMSLLRVQGTIHFRRHDDEGLDNDGEDLDLASNASTCSSSTDHRGHPAHPLRGRRSPIVVVTDQPITIASIHRSAVSEVNVLMASFYFHPEGRQGRQGRDDGSRGSGGSESEEDRVAEAAADCDEVNEVSLRMLGRLSADLSHLLRTQESSDVLLQVGDLPIKAHKAVLVARSEVFRQMLEQGATAGLGDDMGLSSSLQGLKITDAPRDAFLKVLQYVYTADASELAGCEMEVLVLAARFGLADLADECCRLLLCALENDKDLALDFLAFAEQHNVTALKERALLVVVEHLGEVTASSRWRDYKRRMPAICADLLETAARVLMLRKP